MSTRILRVLLFALGAAAIVIGASIFVLGGTMTAGATEHIFALAAHRPFTGGEVFSATADSELRFYAPFWMTYGAACIWVSADIPTRRAWVLPLSLLFLAGGIGRLLALAADGPPRRPFLILMVIEMTLPHVMIVLARRNRSGT